MGARPFNGRAILVAVAAFGVLLTASFIAQWPYRTAAFMLDDVPWLVQIGLIHRADSDFGCAEFLFLVDEDNSYPLWKAEYYLIWRLTGYTAAVWRYVIWTTHVLTAVLAFVFVRSRLGSTLSAALGAVLWATNTISGWDSPLMWIGAGYMPTALGWFLGAMICLDRSQYSGAHRGWPWLMGLCALCAALTWNVALVWLPLLVLQYRLFYAESADSRMLRQSWFWIWLVEFGFLVLALLMRHFVIAPATPSRVSVHMVSAIFTILSNSVRRIFQFPGLPPLEDFLAYMPLFALLLGVLLATQVHRRLALILVLTGIAHAALVSIFRSERATDQARYYYFSVFAVCFAIAIAIDGVLRFVPRPASIAIKLSLLALALVTIASQRQSAQNGRNLADLADRNYTHVLESYYQLLQQVSDENVSRGQVQRFVDVPLMLPLRFPAGVYWPLRGFAAARAPQGLPGLVLIPPDQIIPDDIVATHNAVSRSKTLAGLLVKSALNHELVGIDALVWLSNVCRFENVSLTVPNVRFSYPEQNLAFSIEGSPFIFRRRLYGLEFVTRPLTLQERTRLIDFLRRQRGSRPAILWQLFSLSPSNAT